MILRPVRPASPIGPPVTNRPVGLTCMTGSVVAQLVRDRRQDDRLDDVGAEPLGADVGVVLGGDDDRPDALRHAVLVLDRDLGLAVGAQVRQLAGLADLGQAAGHPVGQRDRQRHELRASRGRRSRTSSPGRRRRARTPGAASSRTSRAASTPCAMSGDCSLTETSVPQVR